MTKKLLVLTMTFVSCVMTFATDMIVKQKNGDALRFDVKNVEEVIFEETIPENSTVVDESETPLKFKILSENTVEVIRDDSYSELSSVTIPAKVRIDGKVYDVTSIENNVFSGCGSLTDIVIPESVTNIGAGAFDGCDKLKPELLVYDKGTKCYGWIGSEEECTSVVIPDGVKEIGDYAFYKIFYGLTSVTFPESLESIGEMAFAGCEELTTAELSSNLKTLGYGAFMYCKKLDLIINASEADVNVGKNAISDCKSVTWLKD